MGDATCYVLDMSVVACGMSLQIGLTSLQT